MRRHSLRTSKVLAFGALAYSFGVSNTVQARPNSPSGGFGVIWCTDDAACTEGKVCDFDCGQRQCPAGEGFCRDVDECMVDADCGAHMICDTSLESAACKIAILDCQEDLSVCPDGFACVTLSDGTNKSHECRPDSSDCTSDDECPEDWSCAPEVVSGSSVDGVVLLANKCFPNTWIAQLPTVPSTGTDPDPSDNPDPADPADPGSAPREEPEVKGTQDDNSADSDGGCSVSSSSNQKKTPWGLLLFLGSIPLLRRRFRRGL